MRDRYEGKRSGHSFGATYSGVTAKSRPVLEATPTDWTSELDAKRIIAAKTRMNARSIFLCFNSLVRHGYIELRAGSTDDHGAWLTRECRRKP